MAPSHLGFEQPESSFTIVEPTRATSSPEPEDNGPITPSPLGLAEGDPIVQNLYEGPPKCGCCVNWISDIPQDAQEDDASNDKDGTPLVVRRLVARGEGACRISIESIDVRDAAVRAALFPVFEGLDGILPTINYLVFHAPFKPFFYRWAEFEKAIEACGAGRTKEILQRLHAIVAAELAEAFAVQKELVGNGVITFHYLWTIFRPGDLVCEASFGSHRFYYLESMYDGREFELVAHSVEYDGYRYGMLDAELGIPVFNGPRKITELPVFPAHFLENLDEVRARLIERGRKYCSLVGVHYKEYPDYGHLPSSFKLPDPEGQTRAVRHRRVMIDSRGHGKYIRHTFPLREKEKMRSSTGEIRQVPVDITPVGGHVPLRPRRRGSPDRSRERSFHREDRDIDIVDVQPRHSRRIPRVLRRRRSVSPNIYGDRDEEEDEELSEFHLQICTDRINGFCLKSQAWQSFVVDFIRDIEWNPDPFSTLVLPDGYKDLILSFVESHLSGDRATADVISGKGGGLVVLLTGPPGVGKTLTAESVAETLHVPLYAMDLGQAIIELEDQAQQMNIETRRAMPPPDKVGVLDAFSLATRWKAVLLVDECDLYLEPRSEETPQRNRIVTKFLREIEYSSSLLFLTTNRPNALDPALASRINLTVTYPALNKAARRTIWDTFLAHNGCPRLPPGTLDALAGVELNGRRIRNVVKAAGIMARRNKRGIEFGDIKTVLRITEGREVEHDSED